MLRLVSLALHGAKGSLIVVRVMLTIGVLTGLWRSSGTFAILTAWGLRLITPGLFVLAAFVLSCVLSYALGTSFGTVSTLGIALMTIAHSGGVDPVITAGAVMSGIHFGDRGSPSSSCLHLVTSLTGTKAYDNVKSFMKSALVPLTVSCVIYLVLSVMNPLTSFDDNTLRELEAAFSLSPLAILPAVIMLVLPLMHVNIFIAFLVSIAAAFTCSVTLQGMSFLETLSCAIWGFRDDSGIRSLFTGGGLVSMIRVCFILIFSGALLGIVDGTGILATFHDRVSRMMQRFGAYPVILVIGILSDALSCNQTVGVLMTSQIMKKPYSDNEIDSGTLALDIADSTAITAPLVPWCMACYFPLSVLASGLNALLFSCYS